MPVPSPNRPAHGFAVPLRAAAAAGWFALAHQLAATTGAIGSRGAAWTLASVAALAGFRSVGAVALDLLSYRASRHSAPDTTRAAIIVVASGRERSDERHVAVSSAIAAAGVDMCIVAGPSTVVADLPSEYGVAVAMTDGSWRDGVRRGVQDLAARVPDAVALLAPATGVVLAEAFRRVAVLDDDQAWVSAPVGRSAEPPTLPAAIAAASLDIRSTAPLPGPGSVVRCETLDRALRQHGSPDAAALSCRSAGWRTGATALPAILDQGDRSAGSELATEIALRRARFAALAGSGPRWFGRRVGVAARLRNLHGLCRDLQGAVAASVAIATAAALASGLEIGAAPVALAVGATAASAASRWLTTGEVFAAKAAMDDIDASVRALGRALAHQPTAGGSERRFPHAAATVAAVAIEVSLVVTAARVWRADAAAVAGAAVAAIWGLAVLAPLLVSLRIVARRPRRRASGRVPLDVPVMLAGRTCQAIDLSLDGLGVAVPADVDLAEGAQVQVRFGTCAAPEQPAVVVRRDASVSPTNPGDSAAVVGLRLSDPTGAAADELRGLWIHAADKAIATDITLHGSDVVRRDREAGPVVVFGGSRLLRALSAATIFTLGAAMAPPYTNAYAASPAESAWVPMAAATEATGFDPDASWWVQTIGGSTGYGDGGPAAEMALYNAQGATTTPDGTILIADTGHDIVRAVSPDGTVTRLAGNGNTGFSGDGGPATAARLDDPWDVAWIGGRVYVSDTTNHRIRAIDADGTISTVAGTGGCGTVSDGDLAVFSDICFPRGLVVDAVGRLLIAVSGRHQIVRLEHDGTLSVIAGTGVAGFAGDGGPATDAQLAAPRGVAFGPDGSIVFTDYNNQRVRRIAPDGTIDTIAGTGVQGYTGDGGPGVDAALFNPMGVAVASDGTVLVADYSNHRVRAIAPDGTITTAAGIGLGGFAGDGGPATAARVHAPSAVSIAGDGSWLIVQIGGQRIRGVATDGTVTTIAGNGSTDTSHGDGGPATDAGFATPRDVEIAPDGTVYVAAIWDYRVRAIAPDGIVTTVAGTGIDGLTGDGGPATDARMGRPAALALTADGSLYIADESRHRVRRVAPDGTITTVVGTSAGYSGDGGPATAARLRFPRGLAIGADGTLYVNDSGNHVIRAVAPDGTITTIAGNGTAGFSGDGGPATSAQFNNPRGVAVGGDGSLYVSDYSNHRVRKIAPDGTITTVAGTGATGWGGDGGPATEAQVQNPADLVVDAEGVLWIAGVRTIRRVGTDGIITTVAGSGAVALGDGVPAGEAGLHTPWGIDLTPAGVPVWTDQTFGAIQTLVPAPQPPTNVAVDAVDTTEMQLSWDPVDPGPFPLLGYQVTTSAGTTTTVTDTTATLENLRHDTTYDISVAALVGLGVTDTTTVTATTAVDPDARARRDTLAVAGPGTDPAPGPTPALQAWIPNPGHITADPAGNVYVNSVSAHQVWRIGVDGMAEVIAGAGPPGAGTEGFDGDGGPATAALLSSPSGLAWHDGVLYIADTANHRIRAVDPDGVISTVAGTGANTTAGDGGPAVDASLRAPEDVAVDNEGRLLIGERTRVRRIELDGTITTLAGSNAATSTGDGGPAVDATINGAWDLALAGDGTIYVADALGSRIRAIAPDGTITTLAGTGETASNGDGGPATAAALNSPRGIAVADDGTLTIADFGASMVRQVAPDGTISTLLGDGTSRNALLPAAVGPDVPLRPGDVTVLPDGRMLLTDFLQARILVIDGGTVSTFAGLGSTPVPVDGSPAIDARLDFPKQIAQLPDGDLLAVSAGARRVYRIGIDGSITTVAGGGSVPITNGAPATAIHLDAEPGLWVTDDDGSFWIGNQINRLLHVDPNGIVSIVAGTGNAGEPGQLAAAGQVATAFDFDGIGVVVRDPDGRVVVSDRNRGTIYRIEGDGTLTRLAGTGVTGFNGDGRPATDTRFAPGIQGMVFDAEGRLIVVDRYNHRIRRIEHDGTVSTIAGTGVAGYSGEGLPATESKLSEPIDIAWRGDDLIIVDYVNDRVSALRPAGTLWTVAGTGGTVDDGLGDPLTTAAVDPNHVAVLPSGTILWSSWAGGYLRAIPVDPLTPTGISIASARDDTAVVDVDTPVEAGEWLDVAIDPAAPDATVTTDGARVTVTGLRPGVAHTVTVSRHDRFGSSGVVSASVTTSGRPKIAGTAVSAVASRRASIGATIDANGSAVSSVVARIRPAGTRQPVQIVNLRPTTISATGSRAVTANLTGLTPGTRYEVVLAATNERGTTRTTPVRFRTADRPTPEPPPATPQPPPMSRPEATTPPATSPSEPTAAEPPVAATGEDTAAAADSDDPPDRSTTAGGTVVLGDPVVRPVEPEVTGTADADADDLDAADARDSRRNPFTISVGDGDDATIILAADGLVPDSPVVVRHPTDGSVIERAIAGADGRVVIEIDRSTAEVLGRVVVEAVDAMAGPFEVTIDVVPDDLAFADGTAGTGRGLRPPWWLVLCAVAAAVLAGGISTRRDQHHRRRRR